VQNEDIISWVIFLAHLFIYYLSLQINLRCKRFYLGAKFVSSRVVFKLQLEDELLKKEGVMLRAVSGLVGWFGKPIRVRLGIRLDPFLGVKLASLYKERTCTS
jgi:hypothetical protein